MAPILQLINVTKKFGQKDALTDVNLTLDEGRIVGLLGPNGSGKTTMLKLLNGLIQPNSGEIIISGFTPGIETRKLISYLPDKNYLNGAMKVSVLFEFFSDFYKDFDKNKAKEMLQRLNIEGNVALKTLSRGTQEKVQLILVMSRAAKLYLLDEPIGGVDPAARDYIMETILKNYAENSTIVISTHLIGDIEQIFDDVVFLNKGRIALSGEAEEIRSKEGKSIDMLFREVFKC